VAFLMVWFSVSLLGALAALVRQPQLRKTWAAELMLPGVGVVATLWFGMHRMFAPVPESPSLKLALIQPSIPQRQIWDERESAHRFQELLRLSEAALTNKPDLLVWPEAAVPSLFRWDTNRIAGLTIYESITGLARRHGVWMVIGADDAEPNSTSPQGVDYFNSSFLINPAGEVVARYRKRRLVMFGEYVPLARVFPFLRNFTGVTGDFTPGSEDGSFVIRRAGMDVKMSPLICFEDAFPHGARRQADAGTDFLLNLTNNGWFGEGAAQWQHAASALFRAIENGLPLVRCANNGLTCWVDAVGRANAVYFPGTTDIYGAGFKIVQVPVRGGVPRTPTFYAQHGDWFGWSCVAWSALAAGLSWLSRKKGTAACRMTNSPND
jgi:apolipoprotein N-acyltransferase